MKHALAGLLLAGLTGAASAQEVPRITVRPLDDGSGGAAYVGPYGRNLPGVAMFAGRADPATPSAINGDVPGPTLQQIPNEYTYSNGRLPYLDFWQGTMGGGFAF